MYLREIIAVVLIFQIIAFMDCRSTGRRINKRSYAANSYYIEIENRFGVNFIQEKALTCQQVRKSGEYCPYRKKYKGQFLSSADNNFTEGIAARSISPWIYLMDHDEKRRPAVIVEACCVCTNCVKRTLTSYERDIYKYSYRVFTQQFVEKITDWGNITVPHKVSAGCTCAGID